MKNVSEEEIILQECIHIIYELTTFEQNKSPLRLGQLIEILQEISPSENFDFFYIPNKDLLVHLENIKNGFIFVSNQPADIDNREILLQDILKTLTDFTSFSKNNSPLRLGQLFQILIADIGKKNLFHISNDFLYKSLINIKDLFVLSASSCSISTKYSLIEIYNIIFNIFKNNYISNNHLSIDKSNRLAAIAAIKYSWKLFNSQNSFEPFLFEQLCFSTSSLTGNRSISFLNISGLKVNIIKEEEEESIDTFYTVKIQGKYNIHNCSKDRVSFILLNLKFKFLI